MVKSLFLKCFLNNHQLKGGIFHNLSCLVSKCCIINCPQVVGIIMVFFGIHSPRFHRVTGPRFPTFFELIDDIDSSGEPLGDLGEPTDIMIPPGALGGSRWPKEFFGESSPSRNFNPLYKGRDPNQKGTQTSKFLH